MSNLPTITAENLFSVSYTSTRLADLATGFRMTMNGPPGSVSGKTKLKVSNGSVSAQWGSDDGVVLNSGVSVSRTTEGESAVVVDPIYDFFQKMVYFANETTSYAEAVKGVGRLKILTPIQVEESIHFTLGEGKIEDFINATVSPPPGIKIIYDKIEKSPIVRALLDKNSDGAVGDNISTAVLRSFYNGKMLSVGDIFIKFISPLGLELYWVKDGTYSLEPPRLTVDNPKSELSITRDKIINLQMNMDPHNAPDIVIPSMIMPEIMGAMSTNEFVKKALTAGVLANVGGKNIKIATYEIPFFLINPVKEALESGKISLDTYEGGVSPQARENVSADIASFFGAHSRKSSLYGQKTGQCTMVFSPEITQSHSWYKIDGTMCFVSDIRHELTRTSGMTILTIAGVKDASILTNKMVGKATSTLPKLEEAFVKKELDKAKEETKKTKEDIIKGHKKIKLPNYIITEEAMDGIFGNPEKDDDAIADAAVSRAVSFKGGQNE